MIDQNLKTLIFTFAPPLEQCVLVGHYAHNSWWSPLILENCKKVGIVLFWKSLPIRLQNEYQKKSLNGLRSTNYATRPTRPIKAELAVLHSSPSTTCVCYQPIRKKWGMPPIPSYGYTCIQCVLLIPGQMRFYGVIRGYFDPKKRPLKLMPRSWASGSRQILIGLSNDLLWVNPPA